MQQHCNEESNCRMPNWYAFISNVHFCINLICISATAHQVDLVQSTEMREYVNNFVCMKLHVVINTTQ